MSVHWYLVHVFVKIPSSTPRRWGPIYRGRMVLLFPVDGGSNPAKKRFYDSRPSTPHAEDINTA